MSQLFKNSRVFKAHIDGDELLDSHINLGSTGGKEIISNFSKFLHHPPKNGLVAVSPLGVCYAFFLLFHRWRKEKERG